MKPYFEYLSEIGIDTPPDVYSVLMKTKPDKLFDTFKKITDLVSNDERFELNPTSPFSFSANTSMSGGDFPCEELSCRVKRVTNLASFAALYADSLVIINPFKRYEHESTFPSFDSFSDRFINDLVILMVFKPLIEEKIVKINNYRICNNCLLKSLKEDKSTELNKKIKAAVEKVKKQVNPNIKVTFDKRNSLIIHDDDSLVDLNVISFKKLPSVFRKFRNKAPYSFSPREASKFRGLWGLIFNNSLNDILYQCLSPVVKNYSYLTNRKIDDLLIRSLRKNTSLQKSNNTIEQTLPFLVNASITQILEMRKSEPDTFRAYRDAVAVALKNKNKKDQTEVLLELVNPELKKIEKVVKQHKKFYRRGMAKNALYTAASLGIGYFAKQYLGMDVQNVTQLLGVSTIKEIYDNWGKSNETPNDALNNNFYFLWKLNKRYNAH